MPEGFPFGTKRILGTLQIEIQELDLPKTEGPDYAGVASVPIFQARPNFLERPVQPTAEIYIEVLVGH
jgi:hypothetical protein